MTSCDPKKVFLVTRQVSSYSFYLPNHFSNLENITIMADWGRKTLLEVLNGVREGS